MYATVRTGNAWGWSNRTYWYLALKEYRQAIADASEAIRRGLGKPNALTTRGAAYGHLGVYEKALADYDAATKMAPHNAQIFISRALLHARLGNKKKAEEDWERAEELDKTLKKADRGALTDPPEAPKLKKLTADETKVRDGAILMNVMDSADRWPEDDFRERCWLPASQVLQRIDDAGLRELIREAMSVKAG
jgi:tetratricopeptide (TPR) repeat protein